MRLGGGAFSGKDPSKVDRSAAYMARYAAENLVAAELYDRCEIKLAYVISVPYSVSVTVDAFGTGKMSNKCIESAISRVFDLTPGGIVRDLGLLETIYEKTAAYGHLGRVYFSWESVDKIDDLNREM